MYGRYRPSSTKLLTVLGEAHESHALFIRAGFKQVDALRCLQREIPATVAASAALARLEGRMIEPALWDQLRGMERPRPSSSVGSSCRSPSRSSPPDTRWPSRVPSCCSDPPGQARPPS
jgi:hypothetical protein